MPIRILPDPLSLLRPVSKVQTITKTRPADTTTYAAGDVISESTSAGTVWTFPFSRTNGLGGILQDSALINSTAQTLKMDADLYLFDTTIASNLNDNAAFAPSDAEMKTLLTVITFLGGAGKVGSGNFSNEVTGLARVMQCASAQSSIFGVLVARNAYVPTSAEDVTIRLKIIQD